jgi:glycosyltransferase involved in cell wall biosynthesis
LVLEGQTGFLVPSRDAGVLTDRVLKLLYNAELANECGMEERRSIETAFSLDTMTNVYRGLADRSGTRDMS